MWANKKTNGKFLLSSICLTALFLAACSSPEETAENHLQKGKEFFEKGEYDKALLELKTSSQSSDQRSDTYYYMALLDEKNNNYKSMRENLNKTLEKDPNNLQARQKLGKVNLLFGDLDKALEQADFLLGKNANDQEAKLLKTSVFVRQDKKELAQQLIEEVLAANPDNVDALSLKAALFFQGNQLDQALTVADKALEKDGKNLPLRLFKIKVNAKKNNVDAVIEEYKKVIELYPDSDNFKLSLASIYSMTDKLKEAESLLREMVAKSPDKAEKNIVLLEFLNAKYKERVVDEFNIMLPRFDKNPGGALELSKWMLANGYLEAASAGLKQVADTEKDNKTGLTAQTILAEIAINSKEYDKADEAIAKILKADSEFVDASLLKARLYLLKNEVDQAIELLNKIVWAKNDSDNAFMLLGQAYTLKKDLKQADKNYKQALDINPANLQAFLPIYNGYLKANQKEMARQYLEKALKASPNQILLLTNKAELDIAEKKWDDAQDIVQRIALFSKNKTVPLYLQANIFQGKAEYDKAIPVYEKIIADFPNHLESLINLVRSYEGIKQRDKAVSFLESQHVKHPDNFEVIGVLSDLYMADKNYAKAKNLLESQIKQSPEKSVPLYLALAKVEAIVQKSPEGAKSTYLRGLQSNPGNLQLSLALAGLYEQTGDKKEARKLYEAILEKTPNDIAVNNLAAILIDSDNSGDQAKGLTMAEKFKDVQNVSLQDTYAWGLIRNGKNSEGLTILESLILKEPKMPELRYHLGVAHYNNGNKATASNELRQALALAEKYQRGFSGKEQAETLLKELEKK